MSTSTSASIAICEAQTATVCCRRMSNVNAIIFSREVTTREEDELIQAMMEEEHARREAEEKAYWKAIEEDYYKAMEE